MDAAEFRNYLLMRFNDYEVPIAMTAEEVRDLIEEFYSDWVRDNPPTTTDKE